jgi:hypothetical protein
VVANIATHDEDLMTIMMRLREMKRTTTMMMILKRSTMRKIMARMPKTPILNMLMRKKMMMTCLMTMMVKRFLTRTG